MASRSLNMAQLIGHVTRDAETRFTQSGIPVSTFSVATNRRWQDKQTGTWNEDADFHNVVLWKNEKLAEYLQKGKQVYVCGRLQTRSYEKDGEKRYSTEVVAEDVILLGGGQRDDDFNQERPAQTRKPATKPLPKPKPVENVDGGTWGGVDDSDVPFMRYGVPCL